MSSPIDYIFMFKYIRPVFIAATILCICSYSLADTVIFEDGTRTKGLILEEFKDRVVLSTIEGEKVLMKEDIRSTIYDSEEKALIQEGRNHMKKGRYVKAYYTFQKVAEINPEIQEAYQKMDYLEAVIGEKSRDAVKRKIIGGRRELFPDSLEKSSSMLKDSLGLILVQNGKYVQVDKVLRGYGSGSVIKRRDKIVSVWGMMTAYMTTDEVAELLVSSGEVLAVIERTTETHFSRPEGLWYRLYPMRYRKVIGASLAIDLEGLHVNDISRGGPFDAAGLEKGDMIVRIKGKNTRYMPVKEIRSLIEDSRGEEVEIVIRRNVKLWLKGSK